MDDVDIDDIVDDTGGDKTHTLTLVDFRSLQSTIEANTCIFYGLFFGAPVDFQFSFF